MKLRLLSASVLAMTLAAGTAAAQTSPAAASASTPAPDRNSLSYALGYDLGRNLIESGESIDLATVQKALQEGYAKKEPTVPVDQLRTAVQQMEARQMAKAKAAFEQAAAANKTKSDAFLAQNKAKAGVQTLPSGVQYRVVEAGSGAKPTQASTVTLQYKGSLSDGRTFVDTFSPQEGQTAAPPPASLKVSEIPLQGLRDALVMMPAGSRWEVTLPADKAYGNTPHRRLRLHFLFLLDGSCMSVATPAVLSPCIGLCRMRGDGVCGGCLRTLDEIAAWSQMGDDARKALMERLPERACMSHDLHTLLPEHAALERALHPLDAALATQGWNTAELEGLLSARPSSPAAVLAGLVPRPQGTTVLLTRRHDGLRNHGGQVSFPGGRVDAGDVDAVAAALRESDEEIALKRAQVQPIGLLDTLATVSGFLVTPVVAVVDPAFIAVLNPGEVAEVFEVPLDYLMAPENLRSVELEFKGRQRTVLEYDWAEQRIWGATAAILYNLRRRLEAVA